jgi:hypothetical protein
MKLTIVVADNAVNKDGVGNGGLDLSSCNIPTNVWALQWDNTSGHIEYTGSTPNDEITELPAWAFDLIYLDGSHKTEDVFSDLILSTFLLNDKGLIIVDDYSMLIKEHGICPKQAVDIFVSLYKNKYSFTINDRDQAYFKLM